MLHKRWVTGSARLSCADQHLTSPTGTQLNRAFDKEFAP